MCNMLKDIPIIRTSYGSHSLNLLNYINMGAYKYIHTDL